MTTRERMHRLVDDISDQDFERFARLLKKRRALNSLFAGPSAVPMDEVSETPDQAAASSEASDDVGASRVVRPTETERPDLTWQELVTLWAILPDADETFADELEAVHAVQNVPKPVEWPS